MHILVTGSNSIIGSNIIKKLLLKKHNIIAIYHKNSNNINKLKKFKKLIIKKFNIKNQPNRSLFPKVDVIIHVAANKQKNINTLKKRKNIFLTNVVGTKNIFQFAFKNKVKKFIFLSAISTYGENLNGVINEKTQQKPIDFYSNSKYLSEKFINNYKKKFEFFILRLPAIIGTEGPWISRIIKKIKKNKLIKIYNSDTYYNSCLHLDDLCKIVVKCIDNKKKFNGIVLNLSSNKKVRIVDLINFIKKKIKSKSKIIIKKKQFAKNYIINNEKLTKSLKFKPMNVINAIKKYLNNYNYINK